MGIFGRRGKRQMPAPAPVDPAALAAAEAALETGHREYVAAVRVAARAEDTTHHLRRVRLRNHIGPAVGAMYGRDR